MNSCVGIAVINTVHVHIATVYTTIPHNHLYIIISVLDCNANYNVHHQLVRENGIQQLGSAKHCAQENTLHSALFH